MIILTRRNRAVNHRKRLLGRNKGLSEHQMAVTTMVDKYGHDFRTTAERLKLHGGECSAHALYDRFKENLPNGRNLRQDDEELPLQGGNAIWTSGERKRRPKRAKGIFKRG